MAFHVKYTEVDASEYNELTLLLHKKQRMYERMQIVYDLTKDLTNPETKELFLMHEYGIDKLRSSFKASIFEIMEKEIKFDPITAIRSYELKTFDDMYFRVKLGISKCKSTGHSPTAETTSLSAELRPSLYTFDGNIENFNSFYETFRLLVHNQANISKINKFNYLLSCIKGSALNIVQNIPISANNYDHAWDSLLDTYQDSRTSVGRYLDKMLNFLPLRNGSSDHLNSFIEVFDHSYRAIEAFDIENLSGYVMYRIALRALDPRTRKIFEQNLDSKKIPTFTDLLNFVQNHINFLNNSESYSVNSNGQNNQSNQTVMGTPDSKICLHCGKYHMIFRCVDFRNLTTTQRLSRANELGLCHNCLKTNHTLNECKSDLRCYLCKEPHHVLLHWDSSDIVRQPYFYSPPTTFEDSPAILSNYFVESSDKYAVILGTAVVHVQDSFNNYQPCRVLIDSGAQSNFITLDCFQRLGLSANMCPYKTYGLGGERVKNHGIASIAVTPRHCATPSFNLNAIILTNLTTDLPNVPIPHCVVNDFKNLQLADPWFYRKSPIDIILAGDIFPYIYDGKKIIINLNVPVALSGVFGYVVTGRIEMPPKKITEPSNDFGK